MSLGTADWQRHSSQASLAKRFKSKVKVALHEFSVSLQTPINASAFPKKLSCRQEGCLQLHGQGRQPSYAPAGRS